jgi:hypothetical protein
MSEVYWPIPLIRQPEFHAGQMGVPGTDSPRGLRSSCTGRVYYVDPNFPGASDQRDGTLPTDPLLTVTGALAQCRAYNGDTIAVMANNDWYYGNAADGYTTPISEEITVTVPGVRIVGVAPSNSMGVMWTPASDGGTCITVQALDVTIEGFVFTEGNDYTGADGILIEWDGPPYGENCVVRHCYFDDTIDVAIEMDYAWYCHIHHNTFWECDEHGILVDLVKGNGAEYGRIHDNIFHDCAVAMELLGGVDEFHIFRNSIYNANAQGGAAATNEGINTTGGAQNMVYDNTFSCLLPVPANGDWNDLNTGAATDAWVNNHCMNGLATTNPT